MESTKEREDVKVLFLRLPESLHARIQDAAKQYNPNRQRNATKMITEILAEKFGDGSE